jgi:hypothetical protein
MVLSAPAVPTKQNLAVIQINIALIATKIIIAVYLVELVLVILGFT